MNQVFSSGRPFQLPALAAWQIKSDGEGTNQYWDEILYKTQPERERYPSLVSRKAEQWGVKETRARNFLQTWNKKRRRKDLVSSKEQQTEATSKSGRSELGTNTRRYVYKGERRQTMTKLNCLRILPNCLPVCFAISFIYLLDSQSVVNVVYWN